MSAPSKQSRWGSFLQSAVAGVEARLDNILSEEEASNKQTRTPSPSSIPTTASKPDAPTQGQGPGRSSPGPPKLINDRLQERLARAVAAKNAGGLSPRPDSSPGPPSRTSVEVESAKNSPRVSLEKTAVGGSNPTIHQRAHSGELNSEKQLPICSESDTNDVSPGEHAASLGKVEAAQLGPPQELVLRESGGVVVPDGTLTESQDIRLEAKPQPHSVSLTVSSESERRIAELEVALETSRLVHQEELHDYIERTDALSAKLQYLAREAEISARGSASSNPTGSLDKKLAEKDLQIAQLMQEGQKLATTEQKHRAIIKKLRTQAGSNEKSLQELRTWRQKAEPELDELRKESRHASDLRKARIDLETQHKKTRDALQSDLVSRDRTISDLKAQIQELSSQTESTNNTVSSEALETADRQIKELKDKAATLELERNLAADRARLQAHELNEKADRAAERSRALELEMKSEQQIMESKLEAMRVRAEEASTGAVGDAQAKLLRQIETLQTQYVIASENWQGIEATLTARTASLEKERDEALRRESEMRRKARETAARAKQMEEELEETKTKLPGAERETSAYVEQIEALRKRASEAEGKLEESKGEMERLRSNLKDEKMERNEIDRRAWLEDVPLSSLRNNSRPASPLLPAPQRTYSGDLLGLQNFPTKLRKSSAPSSNGDPTPIDRPSSARRQSAQPPKGPLWTGLLSQPSSGSPPFAQGSEMVTSPTSQPLDRDDVFEKADTLSSPHNVVQDMVSVSTIAAGPSVQLVERMSAAIRRLESEKVAAKEEMARISSQRDEARLEIVALMKEVESAKTAGRRMSELEKEVTEINERYQTTLEMLGEKSELAEELKADVEDVKTMYRDLVERTLK